MNNSNKLIMTHIDIPEIGAGSGIFFTTNYDNDKIISLDPVIIGKMSIDIINREITQLGLCEEEIDRLHKMLNSGDEEMKQLAFTSLKEKTIYAGRLIECTISPWSQDDLLIDIVREYVYNNKLNITNKII